MYTVHNPKCVKCGSDVSSVNSQTDDVYRQTESESHTWKIWEISNKIWSYAPIFKSANRIKRRYIKNCQND